MEWFIYRLNQALFGHGCRRKGYKCGTVTFLENRITNIHAHLALQVPPNSDLSKVISTIKELIKRGYWFDKVYDIQECYDSSGLIEYISKEGQESWIPSCTSKAFPY